MRFSPFILSILIAAKASELINESRLHRATYDNDAQLVNSLLRRGADVNFADEGGKVALHIAAELGFAEIFKCLMYNSDGKIKLSAKDKRGWTNFHFAAEGGSVDIIDVLSLTELRCDSRDNANGFTPSQVAIVEGNEEAAVALANIARCVSKDERATETRVAPQYGRISTLLSSLEIGCESGKKGANGDAVLPNAIDVSNSENGIIAGVNDAADVVRTPVISGCDFTALGEDARERAVSPAMERRNYDASYDIWTELSVRCRSNAAKEWQPAARYELAEGATDLARIRKLLLPRKMNEKGRFNGTIGHIAVEKDDIPVVTEPINTGYDLTGKDVRGNTLLHLVRSVRMADVLAKAEPKLTSVADAKGDYPSHAVVRNRREDLVAVLETATADIGAGNERKCDALELAAEKGNMVIAESLSKRAAREKCEFPLRGPRHISARIGDVEMAKFRAASNFEIRAKNDEGVLPAHLAAAAAAGNADLIRFLMKGVPSDATDVYGFSLLHYAAVNAAADGGKVIGMLVEEFGVPTELKTFEGETALHVAAKRGCVENVKALIEWGADVAAITPRGKTALYYALTYFGNGDSQLKMISDLVHADRNLLRVSDPEKFTPVGYIMEFYEKAHFPKIVAMELTPADIPRHDELDYFISLLSPSFARFMDTLKAFVSFEEYVGRGIEDFKTDVGLGKNSTLEENLARGLGIFYAFAAAYYPTMAWIEDAATRKEAYDRKAEECAEGIEEFEKAKMKPFYTNKLRFMLVESFLNEKGRERFLGSYMQFVPTELIEDALVTVSNNGNVCGRVELVANALMLTFNIRDELENYSAYLWGKMARFSEVIIPK